jgi:uridylate kinase
VYDCDPEKNPDARKFDTLTFEDAYNRGLHIMDLTAFTLCRENNMPVIVFDINKPDNLLHLMQGIEIGTLIHN